MNRYSLLSLLTNCVVVFGFLLGQVKHADADAKLLMMVTPVLNSGRSTVVAKKEPSLALMAAKGTYKIDMAWVPGSDGKTSVEQIKYEIHLSSIENFTPSSETLKKTVTGSSQTEISGLSVDTLYCGKIIATYSQSFQRAAN